MVFSCFGWFLHVKSAHLEFSYAGTVSAGANIGGFSLKNLGGMVPVMACGCASNVVIWVDPGIFHTGPNEGFLSRLQEQSPVWSLGEKS